LGDREVSPRDGISLANITGEGEIFFVEGLEGLSEGGVAEVGPAADGTCGAVDAVVVHDEGADVFIGGPDCGRVFVETSGFDGAHVEEETGADEIAAPSAAGTGDAEGFEFGVEGAVEILELAKGLGGHFKGCHQRTP
jgi:hypothetical protein